MRHLAMLVAALGIFAGHVYATEPHGLDGGLVPPRAPSDVRVAPPAPGRYPVPMPHGSRPSSRYYLPQGKHPAMMCVPIRTPEGTWETLCVRGSK